jgi:hypothetical protein
VLLVTFWNVDAQLTPKSTAPSWKACEMPSGETRRICQRCHNSPPWQSPTAHGTADSELASKFRLANGGPCP